MTLSEQLARFLAAEYPDIAMTHGQMPQAPDRCVTVFGSDLRTAGAPDGARLQVRVRGDTSGSMAANDAQTIADRLDDFTGLFTPDGHYIVRVSLESGPAHLGADQNQRQEYSVNFRVWYC